MQKVVIREPADMSWARAMVLATGFFFISVIYLGQIPSFFELAATQATLSIFEQSMLNLGLLALGIALIGLTVSMLYDPKPVARIFVLAFGAAGAGLAVVGAGLMGFVYTSGHKYFPDQTVVGSGNNSRTINWPDASHGWFLHQAWFQAKSVDIGAVGFIALFIGLGIFSYAALSGLYQSGKLEGPLRTLLVQISGGGAAALVFAFLTYYSFNHVTIATPLGTSPLAFGGNLIQNVLLGAALGLVLFALQVWLLPVMTAPVNRQRFMPANYLHAAMLLGNVAGPLLTLFVVLYPLVNLLANILPTDNWFVQCAVASQIPSSCTFTANVGYLVAAIVAGMLFTFIIAAGYLWNRNPAFVRLGSVYAFIFAALAVVAVHTSDPTQTSLSLALGVGVAIIGLVWTIATQKEFVPAVAESRALGCTGQWLVMGTMLFIYLAGFAFFSFPTFLDTEQNLVVAQGYNTIHDAYWMLVLAGVLGAIQFGFLTRRQPLGLARKSTLWLVIIGVTLQIGAAISMNGHRAILHSGTLGNNAYYVGILIEVIGIAAGIVGALQTRGMGFVILSVVSVIIGVFGAVLWYTLNLDEVAIAFTCLMSVGAIVYTIFGRDALDPFARRLPASGARYPIATTDRP